MSEPKFIMYDEIDNLDFYQIPKSLFQNPMYPKEKLSLNSKVIYAFLRDRGRLSKKNGWKDEQGRLFLLFTRESIAEMLEVSVKTVSRCFKELNECQLITEKQQGLNKPNIIYLYHIRNNIQEYTTSPEETNLQVLEPQGGDKFTCQEGTNLRPSNNNINNNKNITLPKGKVSATQKSLINLESVTVSKTDSKKKKSFEELSAEHISIAKQTGDWSKVGIRDLTCYYIQKHNEMYTQIAEYQPKGKETKQLQSFIDRYEIPKEKVCDYIDAVLNEYKTHSKRRDYDYLSLYMLSNMHAMLDDIVRRVDAKLKPKKKQYKTALEKMTEEEREELLQQAPDDDLF